MLTLFWTRDNIVDGIGCIYNTYILIKKCSVSNKLQKGTYCKNINSLLHCHERHLGCPLHFSSQIDNINEKNNVPGFRSGDASVKSIMPL